MELDLRKDQKMMKKTAREFLDKESPRGTYVREMEKDIRGFTSNIWSKMAELGWLGLLLPEKYNGMECDFVDLVIILEEVGRACLPGPFLPNTLAGLAVLWAGVEEQKQRILPKISDGETIMTLAMIESCGRYAAGAVKTEAMLEGDTFIVNGVKMFVPDAHVADLVLVPVRTKPGTTAEDGISLLMIGMNDQGVTRKSLEDTIAKDKLFELTFKNVKVSKENLIGPPNKAWLVIEKIINHGAIAECARMVGGARQVLNLSVNYAKQRKQFDRPIGSFQIIQHYLTDMLTKVEGSYYLTHQAASKLANGIECPQDVSMAKAWVNDAYYSVCLYGHQVHGGVGFTEEFDVGLYFRRAKAQETSFGDTDYHNKIIAKEMGLI